MWFLNYSSTIIYNKLAQISSHKSATKKPPPIKEEALILVNGYMITWSQALSRQ